jgi:hypothetical protein
VVEDISFHTFFIAREVFSSPGGFQTHRHISSTGDRSLRLGKTLSRKIAEATFS